MKTKKLLLLPLLTVACSGSDIQDDTIDTRPPQCTSAEYLAFDAANHANQDIRVNAYVEMVDRMNAAQADPTTAAAVFTDLQENVYTRADLRTKVQGRTDDHFDPPRPVGTYLDDKLMAGFEAGKTATTAIDVALARQAVDKTMIEFFYLSVYHEMVDGTRSHWDEAYGYYGAPSDNAEGGRRGFASVATKRDENNSTSLEPAIFNGIVDGACALALALEDAGEDQIDIAETPSVRTIIEQVDGDMQKVLAYSAGHEAFEMVEIQTRIADFDPADVDEMKIKLAELEPYFAPIERLMIRRGGMSETRANAIRTAIDDALADDTDQWMVSFDAQGIIDALEAEYAIDVKA